MSFFGRYNELVDEWAVGVVFFTLLSGSPPYQDNNLKALVKKIKTAPIKVEGGPWTHISEVYIHTRDGRG